MTRGLWRIRLTLPAENDFRRIIGYTKENFGERQATAYRVLLRDALSGLENGPMMPGSIARDDIYSGLRSYHIARRGRPARHFILYRAHDDQTIDIIRILHDAMDLARHLPLPDDEA